jgi:hypothetical protein
MNLIIKGTKTKLHSRMECYSLCDLITINVNGPFVRYLLTFRSVDKGNQEANTRENELLVGSKPSQNDKNCLLKSIKTLTVYVYLTVFCLNVLICAQPILYLCST